MQKLAIIILATFLSCSSKKEEQETDFCSKVKLKESGGLTQILSPFKDSHSTKTASYVLEDGGGSLIARAWFTEKAEKSIDIQYFIFSTDNVGLIACDYLVRAADRGVKVRLLVDDMMVDAELEDILTLDAHPNIDIKV